MLPRSWGSDNSAARSLHAHIGVFSDKRIVGKSTKKRDTSRPPADTPDNLEMGQRILYITAKVDA